MDRPSRIDGQRREPRHRGRPRGGVPARRPWLRRLAVGALLAAVALGPDLFPPKGPVLIRIVAPPPGARVGLEGLEVLVDFPNGRALPETFRARLNGGDVTDRFLLGHNGAYARLYVLLDGENVLRVAVFGRSPWWPHRLFEQRRELHVRRVRPLRIDRG